jgi:HD-GYP domain-containing protein (c-di-GMP phosphodiesterase class II)
MPTPLPQPLDAGTERLIEEVRARREQALPARERAVEGAFALAFALGALALALLAGSPRAFDLPLALAFIVAYAGVTRIPFALGDGLAVPTQVVFVPMLLLLPTPLVPLMVAAAMLVSTSIATVRDGSSRQRMLIGLTDASFSLVPAATLVMLGADTAAWSHWPAYAAALGAQFAADAVRETARSHLATGLSPRVILGELRQVFLVDALLVPIGLLAAIAAAPAPATALLVLPLVYLLAHFSREREARIAQSIEMTRSFRGTAFLLRDLLESDDEYTGHHTEDVVELSARVAERMGVSEEIRRETELGALLHDIGKIHIPDAVINKPGPLDDAEWAMMKTHTIEGQRMLDQVGGLLTDIGLVVRASHERFDGGGYPDGLAGEAIPLAARIVAACDSFNAMTTTRSYRKALTVSHAVEELRRCSGTQFDPAVVDALLAVVGDPGWTLTVREPAPADAPRPVTAGERQLRQ